MKMRRSLVRLAGMALVVAHATASGGCARQGDAAAAEPDPAAGVLEPAGEMSTSRAAFTATTLPDGRVLLAGGFTAQEGTAAGAEVYDPAAMALVPAGAMRTPRYGHTASLLPDGTVLLAGGWNARGEYLATAEVYDPAINEFSVAPEMTTSRAGHVAIPLGDGRVLLVGGVGRGWTFLASAEIYDPASGAFSLTGPMAVARENHAAVRLRDGRVLVTGGHTGRGRDVTVHRTAEIYDPAEGRFVPTGSLEVPRHKHDAILLPDGRVLVTGGSDERDADGRYASAELYDPRTGSFTRIRSMHLTRFKHQGTSVVLPDGAVLLAGGAERAETYNPESGSFALVGGEARMAGQYSASALLPDGSVLVAGGYGDGVPPRASLWIYRPVASAAH